MEVTDSQVYLSSQSESLVASTLGRERLGIKPLFVPLDRQGVILPMIFYGAQCWASVLCSSRRLAELDSVLVCAL